MFFVMSDIHGCHAEMTQALTHWNRESETLVVLGDLIDRGPDSMKVVQTLMQLKKDYPEKVVVLRGNHDYMFTTWLLETDKEDLAYYYTETHVETVKSFFGHDASGKKRYKKSSRQQRAEHILYKHRAELQFLAGLPLFHETDNCIFVHAGINLEIPDWRTDTKAMYNIRNPFIYSSKVAPKTVFFGHTPTEFIRNEKYNSAVWFSEHGDKVGIDGGCVFGRELHALRVNNNGKVTEMLSVKGKAEELVR